MSQEFESKVIDRLARIETQLEFHNAILTGDIISLKVDVKELQNFRSTVLQRIAWVAGAFTAIGVLLQFVFKYLIEHLIIMGKP